MVNDTDTNKRVSFDSSKNETKEFKLEPETHTIKYPSGEEKDITYERTLFKSSAGKAHKHNKVNSGEKEVQKPHVEFHIENEQGGFDLTYRRTKDGKLLEVAPPSSNKKIVLKQLQEEASLEAEEIAKDPIKYLIEEAGESLDDQNGYRFKAVNNKLKKTLPGQTLPLKDKTEGNQGSELITDRQKCLEDLRKVAKMDDTGRISPTEVELSPESKAKTIDVEAKTLEDILRKIIEEDPSSKNNCINNRNVRG